MFTQACQINLRVKLARDSRKSVKLTMKLSGCYFCSLQLSRKPGWSVNLLRKALIEHKVVAKVLIQHEVVAEA